MADWKEYHKGIVAHRWDLELAPIAKTVALYWKARVNAHIQAMVKQTLAQSAGSDCGNPTGSPIFPEYQPEKFKVDEVCEGIWKHLDYSRFPRSPVKPTPPKISRCNCNAPYTNDIHADWCPERA